MQLAAKHANGRHLRIPGITREQLEHGIARINRFLDTNQLVQTLEGPVELYGIQREALGNFKQRLAGAVGRWDEEEIGEILNEYLAGFFKMPTSSGKSRVAGLILMLLEINALWVVDTEAQMMGAKEELELLGFENVGVYYTFKRDIQPITITTYDSLRNQMKKPRGQRGIELDFFQGFIFDEAHHSNSPAFEEAVRLFRAEVARRGGRYLQVGMTATPDINDLRLLEDWLGEAYIFRTLREAQDRGEVGRHLTVPHPIPMAEGYAERLEARKAALKAQLQAQFGDYYHDLTFRTAFRTMDHEQYDFACLDFYRENCIDFGDGHVRTGIYAGRTIVQAQMQAARFNRDPELRARLGIPEGQPVAHAIHSGIHPEERRRIWDDVKSGRVPVVCGTIKMLGEGLNVKRAEIGMLGMVLHSPWEIEQWLGRFLRFFEGKERALIFQPHFAHEEFISADEVLDEYEPRKGVRINLERRASTNRLTMVELDSGRIVPIPQTSHLYDPALFDVMTHGDAQALARYAAVLLERLSRNDGLTPSLLREKSYVPQTEFQALLPSLCSFPTTRRISLEAIRAAAEDLLETEAFVPAATAEGDDPFKPVVLLKADKRTGVWFSPDMQAALAQACLDRHYHGMTAGRLERYLLDLLDVDPDAPTTFEQFYLRPLATLAARMLDAKGEPQDGASAVLTPDEKNQLIERYREEEKARKEAASDARRNGAKANGNGAGGMAEPTGQEEFFSNHVWKTVTENREVLSFSADAVREVAHRALIDHPSRYYVPVNDLRKIVQHYAPDVEIEEIHERIAQLQEYAYASAPMPDGSEIELESVVTRVREQFVQARGRKPTFQRSMTPCVSYALAAMVFDELMREHGAKPEISGRERFSGEQMWWGMQRERVAETPYEERYAYLG